MLMAILPQMWPFVGILQELLILKDCEPKDQALLAKLTKHRGEQKQISQELAESQRALLAKQEELEKCHQTGKSLLDDFNKMVGETHQFNAVLLKIYKKRVKRAKKPANGEENVLAA